VCVCVCVSHTLACRLAFRITHCSPHSTSHQQPIITRATRVKCDAWLLMLALSTGSACLTPCHSFASHSSPACSRITHTQVNKNVYLKGRLGGDGVALMAAMKTWFQPSLTLAAAVERSFESGLTRTGLTLQVRGSHLCVCVYVCVRACVRACVCKPLALHVSHHITSQLTASHRF
jgi:hypothetical protein